MQWSHAASSTGLPVVRTNPLGSAYPPGFRRILLEWVSEVCDYCAISRKTFFQSVELLEMYLCRVKALPPTTKLQLHAAACVSLCSKFTDLSAPTVRDFVRMTDNSITPEELGSTEVAILTTIAWKLPNRTRWDVLYEWCTAQNRATDLCAWANLLATCVIEIEDTPSGDELCALMAACADMLEPYKHVTPQLRPKFGWTTATLSACHVHFRMVDQIK